MSAGLSGIYQPYRIDIFEDYIYGTGLKHEVFKIHKYGKQPVEFLSLGMLKPTNVLIYHRYKQQEGEWCPHSFIHSSIHLSVFVIILATSKTGDNIGISLIKKKKKKLKVCMHLKILNGFWNKTEKKYKETSDF